MRSCLLFNFAEDTRLTRDQIIHDKLDYKVYGKWWKEALCGCQQSYDSDDEEEDYTILVILSACNTIHWRNRFFFSTQVRINLHADTPDITTNTNNFKDQIL